MDGDIVLLNTFTISSAKGTAVLFLQEKHDVSSTVSKDTIDVRSDEEDSFHVQVICLFDHYST